MKKTNNKGFSLVELIIVIAIMVILVAVIAPQYTKFVQKSRVSADVNTAADMATAIDVAIAQGKAPFGTTTSTSIGNGCTVTAFPASAVDNMSDWPMSKLAQDKSKWVITGEDTNGVSEIKVTAKDGTVYTVYPSAVTE